MKRPMQFAPTCRRQPSRCRNGYVLRRARRVRQCSHQPSLRLHFSRSRSTMPLASWMLVGSPGRCRRRAMIVQPASARCSSVRAARLRAASAAPVVVLMSFDDDSALVRAPGACGARRSSLRNASPAGPNSPSSGHGSGVGHTLRDEGCLRHCPLGREALGSISGQCPVVCRPRNAALALSSMVMTRARRSARGSASARAARPWCMLSSSADMGAGAPRIGRSSALIERPPEDGRRTAPRTDRTRVGAG